MKIEPATSRQQDVMFYHFDMTIFVYNVLDLEILSSHIPLESSRTRRFSHQLVFVFLMRTAHGRSCQLVFQFMVRNADGRSRLLVFHSTLVLSFNSLVHHVFEKAVVKERIMSRCIDIKYIVGED